MESNMVASERKSSATDFPTTSLVEQTDAVVNTNGGGLSPLIPLHRHHVSDNSTASLSTFFRSAVEVGDGNTDSGAESSAKALKMSVADFFFLKVIGEGSFSTVYHCREVSTNREFATKACDKQLLVKEKKTRYIIREKEVMKMLIKNPHPFFVKLYAAFQDSNRLYFVMTLARNGELLDYMKKLGSFDEDVSRFYTAEIVSALEHLHKIGVIHRDLKPENILLSDDMHILISDFGSAKILVRDEDRPTPLLPQSPQISKRSSFVGTAQYVSPEVLNGKPVGPSCDFWALGCIIYQMLSGLPPFRAENDYLIFQNIIKADYTFPDGFPEIPMLLVKQLLRVEPAERLGDELCGGVAKLKQHPFFECIHWDDLPNEKPPDLLPFLPGTRGSASFHSLYKVPDRIEPGLDDKHEARLFGLRLQNKINTSKQVHMMNFTAQEREQRLATQRKDNPYHRFVDNRLILKSGLLDKRKGLFARRRMFLLTDGPGLYYVDPVSKVLKGTVPWSREMRTEALNFRLFFVHTPLRTYSLEDPENRSYEWCEAIEEVRQYYFCSGQR